MLQTKTISYGDFYYGSQTRGYVLDLILTEESTDPAANASQVSFRYQLRSGPSNRFTDNVDCAVTVAGQKFSRENKQITAAYNTTYLLLEGSLTVPHDADGTLTLTAEATLDTPESNPYAPPDVTFSGSMTLTAIPRASTLAATAACIGDASTIVVSRKSADYTHTVAYAFGTLSGYLADPVGGLSADPVKLTDTTLLLPLPERFYEEIPNAPTGVCTLTCTTYLEDTPIGAPQSAQFTVTADPARCAPVLTGTARDTCQATLAVTDDERVIVPGLSQILCTAQASAQKGAAIQSITVNGLALEGESTLLEATGQAITFRAVDSRGYSTDYTVPGLTFVTYVPLSFHASLCRTDPTSGNATLAVQGKWYDGPIGAKANTLCAQFRLGEGTWQTATPETAGGDFSLTAHLTGLDYRTGHTVQIALSDALQSLEKTATVSKGIPVFDWGESDFVFHVPVRFTATDGTEFTLDLVNGQLTAIS